MMSNAVRERDVSEQTRKDEFARNAAFLRIGDPIIVVGNEWENLIVGFVVDVDLITAAQQPAFIVKDYLSGTTCMTFGEVIDFSNQRLNALLKLDPFERWSLISKMGHHNHSSFSKKQLEDSSERLLSEAEVHDCLRRTTFFEDFEAFLEKEI